MENDDLAALAWFEEQTGFTRERTLKLVEAMGVRPKYFVKGKLAKLLISYHTGKLRSPFRKSLALQASLWSVDRRTNKPLPLSPRQMTFL
jgi:hypothetical protein